MANFGFLVLASIILWISLGLVAMVFNKLIAFVESHEKDERFDIKFKTLVFVKSTDLVGGVSTVLGICKTIALVLAFYAYITYAFGLFEVTQSISAELTRYITHLAQVFAGAVLAYIPNLLSIFFIVLVTYYVLKLAKFIVRALYLQQIAFRGFKQEWISPTFQIARFFIIAFALVMVFPYLPGADSPAFKGISVFLGVLISFGSGSAIANIIAGVVLIYMSPYSLGDRVKVGEIVGNIMEMTLLVTRIKTIKNEDVTIPNSLILSREVVNYSSSARSHGQLVIGVNVGLGYDIPQAQAEELMLEACQGVEFVSEEPKPFVLVREMAGSYIDYELNIYTRDANKALKIKSDLQRNILEKFAANGLEVLSPSFVTMREDAKEIA